MKITNNKSLKGHYFRGIFTYILQMGQLPRVGLNIIYLALETISNRNCNLKLKRKWNIKGQVHKEEINLP